MSSKKHFWNYVRAIYCPEPKCHKRYLARMPFLYHLVREHGYSFERAKEVTVKLDQATEHPTYAHYVKAKK
jgi:uncharacterized C2H2 Zn-finger protein